MNLYIQLLSLLYSFLFGIFLYFIFNKLNYLLNKVRVFLRWVLSFIIIIVLALLYFLGLLYINYGYLHFYFLLTILVGYIIMSFFTTYWFTHKKK